MRMEGACEKTENGVQLKLAVTSAAAASGLESISVDQGSGTLLRPLSDRQPSVQPAGRHDQPRRAICPGRGIRSRIREPRYVTPGSTAHLIVGMTINATTDTCSAEGVGTVAR